MPVMFSFFSFCLQICLVGYVVAENITTGIDSYLVRNIPLALVTLLYGAILAYPSLVDGEKAKSFYKRVGNERGCSLRSLFLRLLPLMDFFVNQFLVRNSRELENTCFSSGFSDLTITILFDPGYRSCC